MASPADTYANIDWSLAGIVRDLIRRRRFIVSVTGICAVGAVVISLLLPKTYLGTATVLLPEDPGRGALTSVLGDLAPTAAAFIGGASSGDYIRFRAILRSRTVMESLVAQFGLIEVYDLADSDTALEDAIEELDGRSTFDVSSEFEYLRIAVLDRSPDRAAALANAFVSALNEKHQELQSANARLHRTYLEGIVRENTDSLARARADLALFQQQHGIVDLPSQTAALYESFALARGEVLKLEIAYETALARFGNRNSQTELARASLDAAQSKLRGFMMGREAMLPLAQDTLPTVASQYATLYQEVLIQTEIAKLVRPMYEQARFDETRSRTAVQVLDPAVVPKEKEYPKRMIIVFMSTLSAFVATVVLVLGLRFVRSGHTQPSR